jgi:IS5 family transposase
MKAHIGVNAASGMVHTVVGTAANEADIKQTASLLHGREEAVFANAAYTGVDKRPEWPLPVLTKTSSCLAHLRLSAAAR